MKFFEHLDKSGGFSYERWGDAPVHSIAAALFLKPEEIHYYRDMGCKPTFSLSLSLPRHQTCTDTLSLSSRHPFNPPSSLFSPPFLSSTDFHNPFLTCPPEDLPNRSTCTCNPRHENNFYDHWYSCSNSEFSLSLPLSSSRTTRAT